MRGRLVFFSHSSLDHSTLFHFYSQVITRVEWAVKELKSINVIPAKSEIDGRLFAMRSSDQIFNLLGLLVQHDIQFLWDRQEFLRSGHVSLAHKKDSMLMKR